MVLVKEFIIDTISLLPLESVMTIYTNDDSAIRNLSTYSKIEAANKYLVTITLESRNRLISDVDLFDTFEEIQVHYKGNLFLIAYDGVSYIWFSKGVDLPVDFETKYHNIDMYEVKTED